MGYGLERGMTLMTWACEGPRVFISLWGSLTRVKMDAHTHVRTPIMLDMSYCRHVGPVRAAWCRVWELSPCVF